MAPPELARHAPGLDVLHPVEIGLFPVLRHEDGAAVAHRFERRLRQGLGVDIPLVGEERLDHHIGAVAVRHHVRVGLDLVEQALLLQARDDFLARLETIHAVHRQGFVEIGGRLHAIEEVLVVLQRELRLDVEDVDQRQIVAAADLEIVEVMRRRDLHRARALFRIGIIIADDRDAAADQRQDHVLADQMAQHCLRSDAPRPRCRPAWFPAAWSRRRYKSADRSDRSPGHRADSADARGCP